MEAFAARLQAWKVASKVTFRTLARDTELPYARSTIQEKLTGRALPDWPFVEAFVRACARHAGWPDADVDLLSWRTDYREAAKEVEEEVDRQRRQLAAQRALAGLPAPTASELADVVPAHSVSSTDEHRALLDVLREATNQESSL